VSRYEGYPKVKKSKKEKKGNINGKKEAPKVLPGHSPSGQQIPTKQGQNEAQTRWLGG
jgi:hypothetical protein